MAQPATSIDSSQVSQTVFDELDADIQSSTRYGTMEGPANRALSELALALDPDVAYGTHDDEKWPASQTLRFILVSCGLVWAITAAAFFLLR